MVHAEYTCMKYVDVCTKLAMIYNSKQIFFHVAMEIALISDAREGKCLYLF